MSSIYTQVANPEAPCSCQDCDWTGPASALQLVASIEERISAEEIVPAGECPECGALAHLDEITPTADEVAISQEILQRLINAAHTTVEDWETGIKDGTYEADLQGALDEFAGAIETAEAILAKPETPVEGA
jgi:DNA-binding transcriptional regulator YiaG